MRGGRRLTTAQLSDLVAPQMGQLALLLPVSG